jgi:hypothetical protein
MLTVALGAATHAATTPPATTPSSKTSAPANEYPSVLPLTLEVGTGGTHELSTLRDFTITAQGQDDYEPIVVLGPVDPFTNENTCKRPMPEGITGCVVNGDATVGTLRINWRVPQAGVYRFVLSGRRGNAATSQTLGAFDLEALD